MAGWVPLLLFQNALGLLSMLKIALLFTFAVASSPEWNDWKKQQSRTYASEAEENLRRQVFETNFGKIGKHNDLFAKGLLPYAMTVNKFSDWTEEERESYLNQNARKDPVPVSKCVNWTDAAFQPGEKRWIILQLILYNEDFINNNLYSKKKRS